MSFKLYPYQQDLLNRARQSFTDGFKAPCIVSPCGSGKSVILAEMIRLTAENKKRTLFLVHRKELKDQISQTLISNNVNMDYVYVGMVQTVVRNLSKHPHYDLIVIDENHHTLAKSYRTIIDYFDTYVVGFTATPIRLNGDGLGDVNDVLVEGPTVKWLIDNEKLAPYAYYSIDLTDETKLSKSSTGDYTNDSMDKSLGDTIYGDAVKHYKKLINGQKTILYAHSVKYSESYAAQFNQSGITASHIDAKTPKDKRDLIINKFRNGDILVLCNVDILGEGFDVPDCTAVMLLRPTASLSLHMQQSMRPMRYRPNKIATIIDHVGNVFRHGFPDMDRKWTLDKKQKKNRKESEPYPIWECEIANNGCGMVFPKDSIETWIEPNKDGELVKYAKCPECMQVHEMSREIGKKVDKSAELKKLEHCQLEEEYYRLRDPNQATSHQELLKIAKAIGRKPSWAAFKAKELGLPDTPKWVYTWQPKSSFKGKIFN